MQEAGRAADIGTTPCKVVELQTKTLADCLAAYPPGTPLEFQRFLIGQEAVLAPVYAEFEGLPKGLRERDRQAHCEYAAAQVGLPASVGSTLLAVPPRATASNRRHSRWSEARSALVPARASSPGNPGRVLRHAAVVTEQMSSSHRR